ncbi:hypothetical protein [Granulosicoccus antarcticus]|uniref:OmpA-like domain-containing protein n=1 Tax=Granulosicoccus antarcticus IMCC3135 TaxID=1192854 RepID=A0A2Z2NNW6_9GAMM|nr:hypothetical protein [Granulosicoccus antarcticus]ASJ70530.1 hypothetical protein IMCC3135_02080 [Granulosicoccus antarcticus IMCC3135]
MDMLKKFSIGLCCMALTACATTSVESTGVGSAAQQLIARDLVSVLVQIEQLPVSSTTLSAPVEFSSGEVFSVALMDQFEEVGYGIRTVGGTKSDQPVSYTRESGLDEAGRDIDTYTVNVGQYGVRRSYQQLAGEPLKPVSLMNVKGVDGRALVINDELFDSAVAQASTTPDIPVQEAPSQVRQQAAAVVIPVDLYRQPTRNFRELGRSNFENLLSSHDIVDEAILLFSNDSIRLEDDNKLRLNQLLDQFDANSDVFSLIGCSNGSTSVEGGPRMLAIGRGESVRQELLSAGVSESSILYEACWSDEYYDEMMPRRGVVISLKRHTG